jgi:type VI protein secretion system component Hcp
MEAIMSKQAVNDPSKTIELREQQLDSVAGGAKTIDQSSPKLFTQCCSGQHFKDAS